MKRLMNKTLIRKIKMTLNILKMCLNSQKSSVIFARDYPRTKIQNLTIKLRMNIFEILVILMLDETRPTMLVLIASKLC